MSLVLGRSEISISQNPVPDLIEGGLGSEISKWGRISSFLVSQQTALERVGENLRRQIRNINRPITPMDGQLNKFSSTDIRFLRYMTEKMENILWGKGPSEVGYQDEAGIAHSELIAWDILGIIEYPNFEFNRHDLEAAYVTTFIDIEEREGLDLSYLSSEDLRRKLLRSEQGSESLAYYHAKSTINWKRVHNLSYIRKLRQIASTRVRQLSYDKPQTLSSLTNKMEVIND